MIPIGDDQVRGGSPPVVNWLLIAVNALVFVYEVSLAEPALERLFFTYGAIPADILQGDGLLSLLTSMFLHGGWLHLIGNMVFLAVFGDNIEAVLGHVAYLGFYLLGGLAGSAAHVLTNAGSSVPSVGASGAIAAVLGAYVVMFPRSRIKVLLFLGFLVTVTRITAVFFLGFWAVMQLFNGVAGLGAPTAQTQGVAWFAHIGGFAFGLLGGLLLRGRTRQAEYASIERWGR